MSRRRSISALGIADENLAAFAEHGESFYCESLTDAGSSDSNSDSHPSQVVCTRAEGDSSAEELLSDDTVILVRFCLQVMQRKKVLQILYAQRACMQDCVRPSAQDILPWKYSRPLLFLQHPDQSGQEKNRLMQHRAVPPIETNQYHIYPFFQLFCLYIPMFGMIIGQLRFGVEL